MKRLLIVESPAKIKTISKFLGTNFKIMSTMGHVKDLPPKKIGVAIEDDRIEIEYIPIEGKEKTIAGLAKEAQKMDEIYLGPDPDREGEIIAWHIAHEIQKATKKKIPIYRITFNEITKTAILEAIENPSAIDLKRVSAQQARRVLDRWVGYEVSPVLWKKIAPGLSAGRVQSVALRLICDRETEIRSFVSKEYWSIEGLFNQNKTSSFTAQLTHVSKKKLEIDSKQETDKLLEQIKKESFVIDSITDKTRIKNPNAPFITSTLQQAAYNRLGFSVDRTMKVAQKLYEGLPLDDPSSPVALITYMRTDSTRIAQSAIDQVRSYIKKEFSKEYLPSKAIEYGKKGPGKTQDAHEAIRPISVTLTPQQVKKYLPADAAKLYELIWKRFVSCQMESAQYAQRQVVIVGGKFTFKVTGSSLLFDGFLAVYTSDEDDDEKKLILPTEIKKGPVDLKKTTPKQHFTQPPARFTQASLVKELEKEGIGRPSTYAAILSTITSRAYTTLDTKKRFIPTELGMAVSNMLVENLPRIVDKKFTAHMELDLDKVAAGEIQRDDLLLTFYKEFQKDLKKFKGDTSKGRREPIATELDCPSCHKGKLAIRFGKTGEFIGCTRYPDCSFTANFKRDEQGNIELIQPEKPALLDEECPECGKQLRTVTGKFGSFVSCSGYPDCKYIKKNKAPFACPIDQGEVIQKFWRGGSLWGCANYPKCTFAIFDQFEETPCPQCKWPFLLKKIAKDGTETIYCANKQCGYRP